MTQVNWLKNAVQTRSEVVIWIIHRTPPACGIVANNSHGGGCRGTAAVSRSLFVYSLEQQPHHRLAPVIGRPRQRRLAVAISHPSSWHEHRFARVIAALTPRSRPRQWCLAKLILGIGLEVVPLKKQPNHRLAPRPGRHESGVRSFSSLESTSTPQARSSCTTAS